MTPPPLTLQHRAEDLAAALPPLLVAADRVASTVSQGVHGRRRVGQGETFWQFRRYQFGDPVQRIDWRQSAKSGPVYVRETEWEAAQCVWLWADLSPSMAFASDPALPTKGDRATLVAAALAALLIRGGERVALLDRPMAPATGSAGLRRLAHALSRPLAGDQPSLPPPRPLPRHAQVVLIGDFLSPTNEIDGVLRALGAAGIKGHVLQILDPAEETFPFEGRVLFEGPEHEGNLLVRRGQSLREAYRQALGRHNAALDSIVHTIGWTITRHRTDRPPESCLLGLYVALSDRLQV